MKNLRIDWERIEKGLCRGGFGCAAAVKRVVENLEELAKICGEATVSRKMLSRVGEIILAKNPITTLTPCCQMLEGGVKALAEKHLVFLKQVAGIISCVAPLFLIPDQESEDSSLSKIRGENKEEMQALTNASFETIGQIVTPFASLGWKAELMSKILPNLVEREEQIAQWIAGEKKFKNRLITETVMRRELYRKMSKRPLTIEEQIRRTIKTAAQYVALGEFAAKNGFLICNHTTTNLAWYLQTGAAILHNPITLY